jgi:hypothetical protein
MKPWNESGYSSFLKTIKKANRRNDNIALQLFDGEEMNVDMANFIGIHMMSDIVETGS